MKLGVVIAVYNGIEFLEDFLSPWLEAKKEMDISISFVDSRFKDFSGEPHSTDGTVEFLVNKLNCGLIDYFGSGPIDSSEAEVRNYGISMLHKDCTHILTTAVDEIFTLEQIRYIYNYLKWTEDTALYFINYNNYVGTKQTYIKGFCPKRIWRTNFNGFKFIGFVHDDDGCFQAANGKLVLDSSFPSRIIEEIEVKHYTWLDNETSRKKIEYQTNRGWVCSYSWENGKVVFNKDFYKDKKMPIIYSEPDKNICGQAV